MQKFDEMYTDLPYAFFTKGEQVRDHYKIYDAWLARQPGDMMAKRREDRPPSMWEFLKEYRAMRAFKVVPKPPAVRPSLKDERKGFV